MTPGDRVELSIEKPVAGGRMLARLDGAVVLVSGVLPGERVEARIERVQRGTAWAAVTRVIDASPERIGEPNPCGGCVWSHARYEAQLALKQQVVADAFQRIARLPLATLPPVEASAPEGYRTRARLHVRDGRVGFFREGTHELCDAASTAQFLPETIDLIAALERGLRPVAGSVTDIELAENRDASERAVHLDLAPDADPSRLATLTHIDGLSGVSASHPGSHRTRELWGTPRVTDRFAWPVQTPAQPGVSWSLERDARAFFQGNRYLVEPLGRAVVDGLGDDPIVDLYAGVGFFGVAAAAAGHREVVAVEGDRISSADLARNARQVEGRMAVHAEAVEDFLAGRHRPTRTGTLIVDPPRTGLSAKALRGALALGAPRLVYVSCDVATLARDTRAIVDSGYRMAAIQVFDLFPNTAHVECVVVFDLGS